jgi:DNA-nicking Smr family endonuclease
MTRKPSKPTTVERVAHKGDGLTALRRLRGKPLASGTSAVAKSGLTAPLLKSRSRKSALTEDEQDIWTHVADSVTPVRAKRIVPMHDHLVEPTDALMPPRRQPKGVALKSTVAHAATVQVPVTAQKRPPADLGDFEPRRAKRIGRGHIDIEARIDLHGDRQDEAHARLRTFLLQCYGRGQRTVLVITGKGRETDQSTEFDIGYERRERGVLKRNVPRWLAEPELRAIVVSHTTAHVRHGGEGALYVQLRRIR